jgi:putative tryptophan/tyrosine transport system substrate-binding protein
MIRHTTVLLSLLFCAPGFAQTDRVAEVGILLLHGAERSKPRVEAFLQGMAANGYNGSRINLRIRYADGNASRLPGLAAELAKEPVDIVLASSSGAVRSAIKATTVPVIFAVAADPVASGFVESIAIPGGRVTGVADSGQTLSGRRLAILKQAFPHVQRVAIIGNVTAPQQAEGKRLLDRTAQELGLKLIYHLETAGPKDIPSALAAAVEQKADALLTLPQGLTSTQQGPIIATAARERLPLMFHNREGVEAGALMMVGDDSPAIFRHAAQMVAQVLNGTPPGVIPVVIPQDSEFVINRTTLTALGLQIPSSILAEANEIIEPR